MYAIYAYIVVVDWGSIDQQSYGSPRRVVFGTELLHGHFDSHRLRFALRSLQEDMFADGLLFLPPLALDFDSTHRR